MRASTRVSVTSTKPFRSATRRPPRTTWNVTRPLTMRGYAAEPTVSWKRQRRTGVSPPVSTSVPRLRLTETPPAVIVSWSSASMTVLSTVYAIQVVCTPVSSGSILLSPNAYFRITWRIGFHRASPDSGYQPVTYAPSKGLFRPPVRSMSGCPTLPRTDEIRTPLFSGSSRRNESKNVSVPLPSTAVTQPSPASFRASAAWES